MRLVIEQCIQENVKIFGNDFQISFRSSWQGNLWQPDFEGICTKNILPYESLGYEHE
jgi:hypothetical protein